MANEKFTKGKWVISPASTESATWDEIYAADMETLICSMGMCKQKTIRMTEEGGNVLEDADEIDEAIANAHLIAAAPEMYEILNEIFIEEGMMPNTLGKINQLLNKINDGK